MFISNEVIARNLFLNSIWCCSSNISKWSKYLSLCLLILFSVLFQNSRAESFEIQSDSKNIENINTDLSLSTNIDQNKSINAKDLIVKSKNDKNTKHLFRKKDFIMEHVVDSYQWHFATIGHLHITLPLPIIVYRKGHGMDIFLSSHLYDGHHLTSYKGYRINHKNKLKYHDKKAIIYDFSITKNIVSMIISLLLLMIIFIILARKYRKNLNTCPKGFWMFLEMMIIFVRDDIAKPNIGHSHYLRFMPYLLSIFFFIWLNNLMGLIPGSANVTGNISITFVLALFTFILTNINGNKAYWKHVFLTPGVPKWLLPIMVPIEIIGLFTKPFSLMIRLFANITAGHIILLSIINIIFIFKSPVAGIISVPFGVFMFMLKLLVAFLQAYVFTLMSAIYFSNAVADDVH